MLPRGTGAISSVQFGGGEEVVIARWAELDMAYSLRVHDDVVEIPEMDVGQVARVGLLDLDVDGTPFFRVNLLTPLVDEPVDIRIRVITSVRTFGRHMS